MGYFRSDSKNAYGGVNDNKNLSPGDQNKNEDTLKENLYNQKTNQLSVTSDFWLFQIQSTILM